MRPIFFALSLLWSIALHAAESLPVLIVHSYSQDYPWTERQHNGFVTALQAAGIRVNSSVEYLDTKRIVYDDHYAATTAQYLAGKYRDYRPKAIYVTDDNALSFARGHLIRQFPDIPVFFSGVNNYALLAQLDPRRITGVFERKDILPNLELMHLIAPAMREILVIGDASETFAAIRGEIETQLAGQPEVRAHFISSQRLSTLVDELRGRRERFVFLTTLGAIGDDRGQTVQLADTLAAIVAAGDFTIFSMEDVYLHPGVLGGYVTSGEQQGKHAAAQLMSHLNGTPLEKISPVLISPNEYQIDVTQLERVGLELPDSIAAQSRLLNHPPSFYARHQTAILGALYTLSGLLLLSLFGSQALLVRKNKVISANAAILTRQATHLNEIRESLVRAQHIAGMGNWDWRIDSNELYWSEGIYRLFGLDENSFNSTYDAFIDHVHPDDRIRLQQAVQNSLTDETVYDIVHRIIRADGEVRTVRENAEIIRDAHGKAVRMIGTILDISKQTAVEEALRDNETMLRTVVQGLPVVLWLVDTQGIFLLSEGRGLELLGHRPGQVVGQSLFELYGNYPDFIDDTRRALAGETLTSTRTVRDITFDIHYSPLQDASGCITGAIGVATDVTEHKRTERRLSFLANYDPLTRLPNRALFNDRLSHAMQHATRARHKIAVLFVDLDNFKSINDTLGHSEGDNLLLEFSRRLRKAVRADDTVSRLGGDEFTIILEDIDHEDEATRVANEIIRQCGRPYRLQSRELYVTPSIGIAMFPQDGADAQTLLMNADAAMYRAKETGRNNFQYFNKDISEKAQQHLALSMRLRGALERGEFSLHYQPQIDARDGRILGFEALLRWECAEYGQVPPGVFIPVLEDIGHIMTVGAWVLQSACEWAAAQDIFKQAATTIAVNISARQFRQDDLPAIVAKALAGSGLKPAQLELEITESCLMDVDTQLQTMIQLKHLGVQLSIDDFGTGYSSLSYLNRFPVDRLKIDGSFVRDITAKADNAVIVTSIIGLAQNLGMQVIAEGVESIGQANYLREHGCSALQGNLIAAPMSATALPDWCARWQTQGYAETLATPDLHKNHYA